MQWKRGGGGGLVEPPPPPKVPPPGALILPRRDLGSKIHTVHKRHPKPGIQHHMHKCVPITATLHQCLRASRDYAQIRIEHKCRGQRKQDSTSSGMWGSEERIGHNRWNLGVKGKIMNSWGQCASCALLGTGVRPPRYKAPCMGSQCG